MVLLQFISGIAIIFGIARYNESNKLFWGLLLAFILGFTGAKIVLDAHNSDEQSNDYSVQMYSTQVPVSSVSTAMYYTTREDEDGNVVTAHNPVGQGITSETYWEDIILSEILRRTRDQPQLNLIKPPELCLPKDFSIHHDSG